MVGDPAAPDPRARDGARDHLPRLTARASQELRRFVVLFLYLWVLFGLFVLNERIILRQHGIGFTAQGFALVNAFVLAKVMLLAENLELCRLLHHRPLIYPILFESLAFTVLFICFHVSEKIVVELIKGDVRSQGIPTMGGGGIAGMICVAVILFVSLIPFFAFRNLSRKLGPGRLNAILFGPASRYGRAADE